jgi:transcriptional regulator with XRE-family HTH domain
MARPVMISGAESRALRKAAGLSQLKFAALAGVDRSTISNWEAGRRTTPKWAILLYRIFAAKRQALITGQRPTVDVD